MALEINKEPGGGGFPLERCCVCRKQTAWWYGTGPENVALCPDCAKTTDKKDLPTKLEWFEKERRLEPQRIGTYGWNHG